MLMKCSVIPISDNGGSSSELIRVFGGPGIGDVRSMLQHALLILIFILDESSVVICIVYHRFLHQAIPPSGIIIVIFQFPS
jgi:hypothetical protein